MDIILEDHQPTLLEKTFGNYFLYQTDLYSLMCEDTVIPWLQIIPTQNPEQNPEYAGQLYAEIHKLAAYLKGKGLGPHANIAKIGNKLPYYHIHLVFRNENDQAWPEPIWGLTNLHQAIEMPQTVKHLLKSFINS
ncbi:hypothetical protein CYQ88_02945 [Hydrogenovibrio sp. SC-1]|uniref:hypothetical protein n=1 Tax=Hydrogenovibrio sp. SC-1 TaxID=2065820 RepID=UPI000C7A3A0B|nr:hypothetical protein [Hydrogenovibrio sp. SC-1]PLA75200.1 hypothetical protein CYQ88_02945 [Hydrogenovibrio sp. SC-1]